MKFDALNWETMKYILFLIPLPLLLIITFWEELKEWRLEILLTSVIIAAIWLFGIGFVGLLLGG